MRKILIFTLMLLISQGLSAQTKLSSVFSNDVEIPSELIKAPENPTLLIFTASWCVPCQRMRNSIFPQEEVAELLKKFNILFLDVDTQLGYDLEKKYCSQAVVPYYVILDKELNIVTEQIGGSDAPTFCAFLSSGLPKEALTQDVTSQETLDLISNEDYSIAANATVKTYTPSWNVFAEVGANFAEKPGFGVGFIARRTNQHSEFETGLTLAINDFKYVGLPIDVNIKLFKGAKLGLGIAPQYRFAAGQMNTFDILGRINAGYNISRFTIKAGFNYGFVNQNKGDLIDRVHTKFYTVGVAYQLF